MPPVPRAPGSVPPWAGSSTTMLSPACWACAPNGEPPDPATPPCGEVAGGLAAGRVPGAGCWVCEGAWDGETITVARGATKSSPIREGNLIRRMFRTLEQHTKSVSQYAPLETCKRSEKGKSPNLFL